MAGGHPPASQCLPCLLPEEERQISLSALVCAYLNTLPPPLCTRESRPDLNKGHVRAGPESQSRQQYIKISGEGFLRHRDHIES